MDGKIDWLVNDNHDSSCVCCRDKLEKGHIYSIKSNFPEDPIDFIYAFKQKLPNGTKIRLTIETIEE